jgi:regulator of cell morphogenesis and NO signaling
MLDPDRTVSRTVLEHSETASVFQRHRIDYCCQGGRSIRAAAEERGLDVAALVGELERAVAARRGVAGPDASAMSTPALIDHIVATHHTYLRRTLPFVRALAAKVARVHGDHNPRLRDLEETVASLVDALEPHLDGEEGVLFPALVTSDAEPQVIRSELAVMHEDHLIVGSLLEEMRDAAEDYRLPDWACTSYRTLFAELARLEDDVHRHVHLENHVLMPRFAEE